MVRMGTIAVLLLLICCLSEVENARGYGGDPCSNYKKLSSGERAAGFNKLTMKSDRRKSWKETWYRFTGAAGDKMAATIDSSKEGCLTSPSCGAKYPGYLKEPHPDPKPEESVKSTVCFSNEKTCCAKSQEIEIMKCKDFFIYKLPAPCVKRARYCGNKGQKIEPECDEKKLLFGLTKKYAAKSCKEIKVKRKDAASGAYWVNPDGNNAIQVHCDQITDGGGWTLVYSYTFTNFKNFRSGSNAITPRPNWFVSSHYCNIRTSTTPPTSETDYNAMDFSFWENLGHEFMVKSNINHWIACRDGTGSLVKFQEGSIQCRVIKNIASKCHNYVPDQIKFHAAGNPPGSSLGPDLFRSQSSTPLKEYYYFETSTMTGNWPTHDPCGTNALNHLTDVSNPHGNIYIRE